MTCYQLAAGSEGAKTVNVTAGSTLTFALSRRPWLFLM
jgi:hypothetical protein